MVDPSLRGQYSNRDLIQVSLASELPIVKPSTSIAAIAAMCVQPEAEYRPLMADVVPSLIPLVKNSGYVGSSGSSRFQNQVASPRY
ncbi:unnamed protein product [Prunus armeniaca]|uniref:Serine-threonine/tyrosine-protein kinase catalytic domain-containing protein n=1 Tax=Prunus armeniaca TaxID=36596 RepID=A0A6J5UZ97_PRUAR|nr:unnamed protein product [Prunus armeniaca]